MLHFSRWKIIAILAAVFAGIVLALPNVLPKAWQETLHDYTGLSPMTRGLDLQGGTSLLMEVDRKDLLDTLVLRRMGDIRTALRGERIGYKLDRTADGIAVQITEPNEADKAHEILKGLHQQDDAAQVFDLERSGLQFVFAFSQPGVETHVNQAVEQIQKILGMRLDSLGIAEASVQRQGKDRILILLPGVSSPDRHGALGPTGGLLFQTGALAFQLVCESQPVAATDNPPPGCTSYPMSENPEQNIWVQTASAAVVDGNEISYAKAVAGYGDEPVVNFKFNQKGALHFGKLTSDNVGEPFAIVLDQRVISAPRISEPILGGSGQISGNFTVEQANGLAIVLRSGALPARLVYISASGESDAQAKRSDP